MRSGRAADCPPAPVAGREPRADSLQGDGASAEPRLRVLDSPVGVRASDLNDAGCTVEVALFERERVEERDGVLVAVDREMAVVEVDHRDARAHEA